jgi:hypothetical protein
MLLKVVDVLPEPLDCLSTFEDLASTSPEQALE